MSSKKNPNTRPLGDARFAVFQNDVLTVESTRALPPGSRIDFTLPLEKTAPLSLHGKIIRVEPTEAPGVSRIAVRLHSLTKAQRTALSQEK